jgi:signal transduction histidine kinase
VASLALALREFLRTIDPSDLSINLRIDGNEAVLPSECRDELFLVIREGLRNIFTHARAANVLVRVEITTAEVHAVVEDDGIGFVVAAPLPPGNTGLVSMRERTELLGGRFALSTGPGRGTRLDIRIPLAEHHTSTGPAALPPWPQSR